MTSYENLEDEYQRRKAELMRMLSAHKVAPEASTEDSAKLIDNLQKALDTSIDELRKAIGEIEAIQEYLEGECYQSKLKAVESHQDAQSALASHNMTGVFLNSVDKVAQIKVVQILRAQTNGTGVKLASLKKSLTRLETLSLGFWGRARLIKSQLAAPPISAPGYTLAPSDALDVQDQELAELKKQLEDLE